MAASSTTLISSATLHSSLIKWNPIITHSQSLLLTHTPSPKFITLKPSRKILQYKCFLANKNNNNNGTLNLETIGKNDVNKTNKIIPLQKSLVDAITKPPFNNGLQKPADYTYITHLERVGLLGMARSLQMDLNLVAEAANTSTTEGLHFLLTEIIVALLRHPDFCISAYSSVDVKQSIDKGEQVFNQLSIEERAKFDEETLANMNNIRKQTATAQTANGFSNEYIVITILVAAEGVHKLSAINSSEDLKEALKNVASIPSNRTMAVEILWTPQSENDTLSERELLEDYPLLRPF